jgi:RNA polymerase sigma-70 factor (ECF subfamily)
MGTLHPDLTAFPQLLEAGSPAAVPLQEEVAGLYAQYRAPLYRFVLSMGLAAPDTEEVVQEAFLALFQHLRAGKPRDNLRAWLFQVCHNQALKIRQRKPPPVPEPVPLPSPEHMAMESQQRRRMEAIIRALPEQDRACLALRAEGLRYREIAGILRISLGGVALSMERALARMQRLREREYAG